MLKWLCQGWESLRRSWRSTAGAVTCDSYHRHGRVLGTMAARVRYWNKCCKRCPRSFCSGASFLRWRIPFYIACSVLLHHPSAMCDPLVLYLLL